MAVRSKNPTVMVVLFEDSAALIGLTVAAVGISLAYVTQMPVFDAAASIVIGLVLLVLALFLARETKALLIGESANRPVIRGIRQILKSNALVEHVNEILTMHMGPDFILANISVDFEDNATADEIESVIAQMDQAIKKQYPQIKRIFIEAEKRKDKKGSGV